MNPKALLDYYQNKIKENPFYPIGPEDFHKAHKFVITITGLEYLTQIKRKFVMGEKMTDEERANFLFLLLTYATTNRDVNTLREWNEDIIRIGLTPTPTLFKKGYTEKNPNYDPTYFECHETWQRAVLKKYYSLVTSGI